MSKFRLEHNAECNVGDGSRSESILTLLKAWEKAGNHVELNRIQHGSSRTTYITVTFHGERHGLLTNKLQWGKEPWQTVQFWEVFQTGPNTNQAKTEEQVDREIAKTMSDIAKTEWWKEQHNVGQQVAAIESSFVQMR